MTLRQCMGYHLTQLVREQLGMYRFRPATMAGLTPVPTNIFVLGPLLAHCQMQPQCPYRSSRLITTAWRERTMGQGSLEGGEIPPMIPTSQPHDTGTPRTAHQFRPWPPPLMTPRRPKTPFQKNISSPSGLTDALIASNASIALSPRRTNGMGSPSLPTANAKSAPPNPTALLLPPLISLAPATTVRE